MPVIILLFSASFLIVFHMSQQPTACTVGQVVTALQEPKSKSHPFLQLSSALQAASKRPVITNRGSLAGRKSAAVWHPQHSVPNTYEYRPPAPLSVPPAPRHLRGKQTPGYVNEERSDNFTRRAMQDINAALYKSGDVVVVSTVVPSRRDAGDAGQTKMHTVNM